MGKLLWFSDDGFAIYYVLGVPDFELLGITTVFGNSNINNVMKATKKIMRAIGRDDIPILKGAAKKGDYSTEAAKFLAEQAVAHPGEISLLAMGPLTNLKGAAELDPNFFKNLKEIVLMGGIIKDRVTIGRTKIKDVNLRRDDIAAFHVLQADCPVTVFNCHICKQAPFTKEHLKKLEFWPKHVRQIFEDSLWLESMIHKIDHTIIWDLLVPVYLTNPELFDDNPVRIRASKEEDVRDGRLYLTNDLNSPQIQMPSKVLDPEKFVDVSIRAWKHLHEITAQKIQGYPGLKQNPVKRTMMKFFMKLLTGLFLRFVYKKEGKYYVEP